MRLSRSSSPSAGRRHRVSRRLITRARAARQRLEQGAPQDGSAVGASMKGASGRGSVFVATAAGGSGAPPDTSCSWTSGMSNTICILSAAGARPLQDLSESGEIAHLCASLAGALGAVLVTYFDVRCAQSAVLHMAPRATPHQPAARDRRIVSVDLLGFRAKAQHAGGFQFQDFGEVAHVSMFAGMAVVEFYDTRSAQALLRAASGCATLVPRDVPVPSAIQTRHLLEGVPVKLPVPPSVMRQATARAGPNGIGSMPESASEQAGDVAKHCLEQAMITHEEVLKFEINPEAILRGEDKRTSVIVRHLRGVCARRDLLLFLERCGLSSRFSLFYMPCRKQSFQKFIWAGWACVNFVSPQDVLILHSAAESGHWRDACSNLPSKSPVVIYARAQGHEDLVQHFNLRVLLQQQDLQNRPILRPEVLTELPSQPAVLLGQAVATNAIPMTCLPGAAEDAEILNSKKKRRRNITFSAPRGCRVMGTGPLATSGRKGGESSADPRNPRGAPTVYVYDFSDSSIQSRRGQVAAILE
ncbi:unnamed protein product [Prorocentrum cordatum]|nr:unnamed protein product [Polarella glacialis]